MSEKARLWKSLADRAGESPSPEDRRAEFAVGEDLPPDGASRREFMKLMGASMAMAAAAGCTRAPRGKIVPYTTQPPEVVPGIAAHYATALTLDGYAQGLIVESHEGRPTKIEGNPKHPATLGGTLAVHQASILGLYDPSRARAVHTGGKQRGWLAFYGEFCADSSKRAYNGDGRGRGLHFLMPPTSSALVGAMLDRVRDRFPEIGVTYHAPFGSNAAHVASRALFGRALETQIDFTKADVVVALDADFLAFGPFAPRWARQFARRRRLRGTDDTMGRLYVVESALTVTGAYADHRLRAKRSEVPSIAAALLGEVLAAGNVYLPGALLGYADRLKGVGKAHAAWIAAVARDLARANGRVAIVVGEGEGPDVHAIAHLLHRALGAVGNTVTYTDSPLLDAGTDRHDLAPLSAALDANAIDTLVVFDHNPVYASPSDLDLVGKFSRAKDRVYLGLHENETARAATWFIAAAHYLETWGDARAYDGTASIVQPLLEPLYGGRTVAEVLAAFAGDKLPVAHDLLRARFAAAYKPGGDEEEAWERSLADGVIAGTTFANVDARIDDGAAAKMLDGVLGQTATEGLEAVFVRDVRTHGGEFANIAWLLELPDPITKLTWENAALVSPATAQKLGVAAHEEAELSVNGRSVSAAIFVVPGQADDTVIVPLGWGRSGAENLARGLGFDGHSIQPQSSPRGVIGLSVKRTGKHPLATTQEHASMEDRPLVKHATLAKYKEEPKFAKETEAERPSLYKLPLAPGASPLAKGTEQWAMAIDLNACTGCSACVIACQAENNIPVVGKAGVQMSREMHWLRIDRYFVGPADEPRTLFEPMLCQHCESAPCEYVCPVNATVHSPDGINEQVYNRCVGTRFCSNNCAWKVRRFNWFNFHEQALRGASPEERELHAMVMNPDVTVRARGVMEKCTFCVQRVRHAGILARTDPNGERPVRDGDVVTACAQACPTEAIHFGSLTWKDAEVTKLREDDRAFEVLGELGTKPRVRYLAKIVDENPEIER